MHILPEIAFSFPLPLSQVAHVSITALEKKKHGKKQERKKVKTNYKIKYIK
jgi:hypothetical protein